MGVGDDIAPRFTQKPVLKQEDNGKLLVFQCTLEASPKPDLQWFQGTTPLSQSDRIKMRIEPAGGNKYNATNKTDRHDITEILLKVVLNTIPYHSVKEHLLCSTFH
jgi:hypothetical protein